MLEQTTAHASFVRIEEEVQRFWRRTEAPHAQSAVLHAAVEGPPFGLYRKPLIAVGQPWADQVRLLATADLFARYRAMRGHAVQQQAGWSCHGLPVELPVERSWVAVPGGLGPDGAGYDMAQFNAACREAALQGVREGEQLTDRLGIRLDLADSYVTLSPQTIGKVWGVLKQLWDDGRLVHERLVVPVCPRCATPVSTAEAQRCATALERRSIWMQLPWTGEPNSYFLVWTPDPWMLVGMVALVAHPDTQFALVELAGQEDEPPARLLLSEAALERELLVEYRIVRSFRGKALRQARYRPPFTFLPAGEGMDRVVLSTQVPSGPGTGLLPVTPAFDALSLSLAQAHRLPVPELLDDWGSLRPSATGWQGLSPFEAEPLLVQDLKTRGLLFREETKRGQRALCPYCQTPLLPQARPVWLVTAEQDLRIVAPEGWIVGRDRPWGVPLPVWGCERCGEQLCVAGLDDLARRTGFAGDQLDLHRPAVDRMAFPCARCGGTMRRTAAVLDAAFETAVVPLCTAPQPGPIDLAVGLDEAQSGWLADLAAVAALLRRDPLGQPAWEQVAVPAQGKAEPAWEQGRSIPASALRWAAYTGTPPDHAEEAFLRPLWQLVSGFDTAEGATSSAPSEAAQQILNRWERARLSQAIDVVTGALEHNDARLATAELEALVDDLVDWNVPHPRSGGGQVLETISRLLAPFVPHLAEAVFQRRKASGQTGDSVHEAKWPAVDPAWVDPELLGHIAQVRQLARLGQTARSQAGISSERLLRLAVAGPCPRAERVPPPEGQAEAACGVGLQAEPRLAPVGVVREPPLPPYPELLAQRLGVEKVEIAPDAMSQVEWYLAVQPEQTTHLDMEWGQVEAALAALPPDKAADLASQVLNGLSVSLPVADQAVMLLPDQVRVTARARPGWTAAAGAGFVVLLAVG